MSESKELISMASHKLLGCLGALNGALELLADGTAGSLNDVQNNCFKSALRSADRLKKIITDLSYFQKCEAGLIAHRPRKLEMTALLDRVLADGLTQEILKGITWNKKYSNASLEVLGDEESLWIAIEHMIEYAAAYHAEGFIQLIAEERNRSACIIIRLEESEIQREDLPKLYERFPDMNHPKGQMDSGLGLAISKWVIEKHGGRVGAEGFNETGIDFIIFLPLALSQ